MDSPLLSRATLAGLIVLSFCTAAGLAGLTLTQTNHQGEADAIAWLTWWLSILGGLLALGGLFVPALRRL